MRRTPWRAVSLILILGLAVMSCDGPNRGTNTQPSSASGQQVVVTAATNTLQGIPPGSDSDLGACTVVQAKVFDTQGRLVDGATVFFAASIGVYREGTTNFGGVTRTTVRGNASAFFCALSDRGTANITATVEDAVGSTQVTII